MSKMRLTGVLFVLLVLVGMVATAVAADDPIWEWEEASIAPQCRQIDSLDSPYVIECVDDDITAARVKEVNVRCVAEWDATHFTLAVVDETALGPTGLDRWDGGALYWSVIDAEGNVVRGEYHR